MPHRRQTRRTVLKTIGAGLGVGVPVLHPHVPIPTSCHSNSIKSERSLENTRTSKQHEKTVTQLALHMFRGWGFTSPMRGCTKLI